MPHAFAATLKSFTTACGKVCRCYSLLTLAGQFPNVRCLPVSMRIALEAELQQLHWQFRRPEARPQCGHQPKRPGLRGDAAGQPQLRAAHSAQSQSQFFGQPAAGGGLCDFRHGGAARPEHRTGGQGSAGKDVCLVDTWPSSDEIHALMKFDMNGLAYQQHYARIATEPGERWERIKGVAGTTDSWPKSTYIVDPPFLTTFTINNEASDAIDTRAAGLKCPESVRNARIMALLGDSISTDHVSPAGAIK